MHTEKVKEISRIAHLVRFTWGFGLGIFQYTYHVFLFGHLGGDATALTYVVSLVIFYELLVLSLEIPTGALGDYLGRKKTVAFAFAFATICSIFRTSIYFTPSIPFALTLASIGTIFSALCYTFYSGSFVAWVVDSIRLTGSKEGHGTVLAHANSMMIVGKIVGAVIGLSFFLSGVVYFAFAIGCFASLLCTLYLALVMKETETMAFHRGPFFLKESINKMKEIIVTAYRVCVKTPPVAYLIVTKVAFMNLIHIVLFLWPIAMKSNFGVEKMSPYWYVLVFSCFFTSFGGSHFSGFLNRLSMRQNGERISNEKLWLWLIGICFLSAFSILTLGFGKWSGTLNLALFITCIALFNIGYGFLLPAHDTLINYYIPVENSKERATILSVTSMLTSLVMAVILFPSSGPSGEETTIGWILPATILLFVGIVMHFLMRRYQQRAGEITA